MSRFLNKTLIVLLSCLIILLSSLLGMILWYDWPNNRPQITEEQSSFTISQIDNHPPTETMLAPSPITTDSSSNVIITPLITFTVSPTSPTNSTALTRASTRIKPFPPATTAPTRIIASAIDLNSSVTQMGWALKEDAEGNLFSDWMVPEFAAGWHINSTLPGHGGNTVLSAHHNIGAEVFRNLIDLEAGDHVAIEAGPIRYEYTVEEKYIVKEEGVSAQVQKANYRYIEPTTDERLTLVSCWPYESNSHRVIIIARPVGE